MKIAIINASEPALEKHTSETLSPESMDFSSQAEQLGITCEFFHGRNEGELVTLIQNAWDSADGVVLSPGDYAAYSIAIRDAIASINKPVIEVYPANPPVRGDTSHGSVLSAVCKGIISGFGLYGYTLALRAFAAEASAENQVQPN